MATCWYAIHTKPHGEEAVWRQIQTQGFGAYYPRLHVEPVNPRARKVRPYFPRYLFVKADLDEVGLSPFNWMPGAVGLLSYGDVPVPVPDDIIDGIRENLDRIGAVGGELFLRLKPGDPVVIQDGPFAGYQAIFDARLNGKDRVRVLLQLLNDGVVRLELRAAQIEPARSLPPVSDRGTS